MLQKLILIYLTLCVGIGIDPCCCMRAWVSDQTLAAILLPLKISNATELSAGELASPYPGGSSDPQNAGQKISCCDRNIAQTEKGTSEHCNECALTENEPCDCKTIEPLTLLTSHKSSSHTVILTAWLPTTLEVNRTIANKVDRTSSTPLTLSSEALSLLCRWNC